MEYTPDQASTAAFAVVVNLLETLVDRGALSENDLKAILQVAADDLAQTHAVGNQDGIAALTQLAQDRYSHTLKMKRG